MVTWAWCSLCSVRGREAGRVGRRVARAVSPGKNPRKSETESKRRRKDGSGAFANLPTPKQINRVFAVAFKKFVDIENRQVLECHGEAERWQRLVCLPFCSTRKGIHRRQRRRRRNEFINNSASVARATQRPCERPRVRQVRGTHAPPRPRCFVRGPFPENCPGEAQFCFWVGLSGEAEVEAGSRVFV